MKKSNPYFQTSNPAHINCQKVILRWAFLLALVLSLPFSGYSQNKLETTADKTEDVNYDVKRTKGNVSDIKKDMKDIKTDLTEFVGLFKKDKKKKNKKGKHGTGDVVEITILNADFNSMMTISKYLNGLSYVTEVEKGLEGNVANLSVAHTGDMDALVFDMMENSGVSMEVKNYGDDTVQLVLK